MMSQIRKEHKNEEVNGHRNGHWMSKKPKANEVCVHKGHLVLAESPQEKPSIRINPLVGFWSKRDFADAVRAYHSGTGRNS